jgi:deferrochelatase/peroxidase EfeB
VIETLDIKDIQGNILRGYRRGVARNLILEVTDRAAARRFLAASVEGDDTDVPAITRERSQKWPEQHKPDFCFNIGLTYEGLRTLGVPADSLATFPTEFIEGMTSRAMKLGDFGDSAPEYWPAPFDEPKRVHIIARIHANDTEKLQEIEDQVARAFNVIGVRDGRQLDKGKVIFGYVDGLSQPRFKRVVDPETENVNEPEDPLGTILLGYPTGITGLEFSVPQPHDLGFNGTFNAFRVLAQDAAGFEAFLDRAATELETHPDVEQLLAPGDEEKVVGKKDRFAALREVVAAQMCGRWRNGVPYGTSPDAQLPDPMLPDNTGALTNFDYHRGSRCPAGSHMRRSNPRGGSIVQRMANYSRRLVRRGMVYGPDFDPNKPDDRERGLLGSFIGANLGAQFEAVMCDWINLGLHDPDVTGANDPLLGANTPETSWFDLTLADGGTIRIRGFPRFVTTRGGAYTFLPSLTSIRYLSRLTG